MNCERVAEEVTAYLDGELPKDLALQVEAHLKTCPGCAAELHTLRDATAVIAANVPEIELRPEIWHNVRARIEDRPASKRGSGWLELLFGRRWLVAATAAIALTVGIWGYYRYLSAQQELHQYMSQYIRERDRQEQAILSRPDPAVLYEPYGVGGSIEAARNPFSVVNFSPEENPFRSEDR
jgi:anti-sigma factor RsiW